ncbi:Nucleic-acid-binding protein from transposon X-element [Araneus ventricosus]|uniref:Nucleic-acid-binding protein from transposon X-element n=1 Tax=Araneus ventricosus TaxID=182803 RepID=A0A4Y2T685_ARAVE|nr:Nucleic-acid-binding protein from transposon X-element [Araneus ventricosus]
MEVDKQKEQDEVKKSENDIPAINLLMDSNYNLTLQEIANKFPKTTNKLVKGFISITADTEENRNKIISYLNETNKEYVLSEKREDRPLKIIIKRLPIDHSKELIQQDLENQNFKVIRISQLRNYKLKSFHPIFLVEIAKKGNYTNIFNLKSINHLSVKIESYRKKNKATICFKCSRFYHSARNCMCQARCIKCSKNHETRNCDIKTRIESPKCINCLETGHLASWRGCPKFPNITRINNRQTYAQKVKNTPISDPPPHRKLIETKEPTNQDMNEVSDLLNAIKIIKDALKEFPNILEISKQLKHCKDKQDRFNLLLQIFN